MTPPWWVNLIRCPHSLGAVPVLAGTPGQPAYTSPMWSRLTPLSLLKLGTYLLLLPRPQPIILVFSTPSNEAQAGHFGPGISIRLFGPIKVSAMRKTFLPDLTSGRTLAVGPSLILH